LNGDWQNSITQALSSGPIENQEGPEGLTCRTETEAVDRALDLVISEHHRNRLAGEANERFVTSGINIRDVYIDTLE
jgi:hypothetical protein